MSPAIGSDGTIYVGSHDNFLYAIGKPNLDDTNNWYMLVMTISIIGIIIIVFYLRKKYSK